MVVSCFGGNLGTRTCTRSQVPQRRLSDSELLKVLQRQNGLQCRASDSANYAGGQDNTQELKSKQSTLAVSSYVFKITHKFANHLISNGKYASSSKRVISYYWGKTGNARTYSGLHCSKFTLQWFASKRLDIGSLATLLQFNIFDSDGERGTQNDGTIWRVEGMPFSLPLLTLRHFSNDKELGSSYLNQLASSPSSILPTFLDSHHLDLQQLFTRDKTWEVSLLMENPTKLLSPTEALELFSPFLSFLTLNNNSIIAGEIN